MQENYDRPFIYAPQQEPFLNVVYHDDDVLILDKPAGLLSVPGKPKEHSDCLVERARTQFPSVTVVHRLDLKTSGVMIFALNREAHRRISLQFEKRKVQKTYIARVWGAVEEDQGVVDLPLLCDWPNRPRQMVDHENGRAALTNWAVLEREESGVTRLRLTPLTGRSHQLRVHMLAIGHPILGDDLYAPDEAYHAVDRLQLHAETLSLFHPTTNDVLSFTVPCPF